MNDFETFLNELYVDRDYYSRAKIIELIKDRYKLSNNMEKNEQTRMQQFTPSVNPLQSSFNRTQNDKCFELLSSARKLLIDLKRCSTFYSSSIEIDEYIKNSINGEEFEDRINLILKRIEEII